MRRVAAKRRANVKATRKPRKSGTGRRHPIPWWRVGVTVGWVATFVALAWGARRLEHYTRTFPASLPPRLEWVDLPAWLSEPTYESVLAEIEAAADVRATDDIHHRDLTRRVADGLLESPWVAEVRRVAKLPSGVIRVAATFREPMAYVSANGRGYLVDAAGVRLLPACSVQYVKPEEWFRITGVGAPTPDIGQTWSGQDLAAGLKLVQCLRQAAARGELPFRSWLTSIDVANYHRREREMDGRLRISTISPGCYIDWGEPPGDEYPVEAGPQRKLQMLNSLFAQHGQLPERVIVVRWPDGIDLRPPAAY